MAINAYCGVMGSGKSYEVVSGPLLDAVAAGRRVVTNIDGVDEALIHAYLHEKRSVPVSKLGRIVHVRTDDLNRPGFFPVEVEDSGGATVTPGFVLPGDLVVIDEAWKLWSVDNKISREHMTFFRMHRHFVHPDTGVACDVALMIQSIADLHRSIRAVIELSFVMVKLKSLGMSKSYRVEMYETSKQNTRTRTGTFVRRYSAEIFPLYKSYAGGSGTEASIDRRQNVLTNKWLWVLVAVVLVAGIVGLCVALRFFHHRSHAGPSASLPVQRAAPSRTARESSAPHVSDEWRIAGSYHSGATYYVVLANSDNRLRVESPSEFMGQGIAQVGTVDGQRVTTWSGSTHSASPLPLPGVPK